MVTRSVNALGPTWTLVTFKGPGGANGILNGKALNTDILNVAFAPKKKSEPTPEARRQIELLEKLVAILEQREGDASRRTEEKRRLADAATRQLENKGNLGLLVQRRLEVESERARDDLDAAREAQQQMTVERTRRQIELEAALDSVNAAAARSQTDAAETGRALINTQILQSLNVQPR